MNKIEFTLKELFILYSSVILKINDMETPHFSVFEQSLQYSEEREKDRKEKHLNDLKTKKEYQELLSLKEKLENITINANFEE